MDLSDFQRTLTTIPKEEIGEQYDGAPGNFQRRHGFRRCSRSGEGERERRESVAHRAALDVALSLPAILLVDNSWRVNVRFSPRVLSLGLSLRHFGVVQVVCL